MIPIVTIPNNNLTTYYIAYFDILGYKAFFDDCKTEEMLEFLNNNIKIADDIERKTANGNFLIKSFSDNFMILLDAQTGIDEYNAIEYLSRLVAILQLRFLEKYSILIRGCITKGEVYIDENIVFGKGLISAVSLENAANFPRIIVDSSTINKDICKRLCKQYLSKDDDDEFYVDFFKAFKDNKSNLLFQSSDIFQNQFITVKENIIKLVNKYGKYNRQVKDAKKISEAEKTISKYAWLLMKFNQFCEANNYIPISYKLVLYYRLMKCEIQIDK